MTYGMVPLPVTLRNSQTFTTLIAKEI